MASTRTERAGDLQLVHTFGDHVSPEARRERAEILSDFVSRTELSMVMTRQPDGEGLTMEFQDQGSLMVVQGLLSDLDPPDAGVHTQTFTQAEDFEFQGAWADAAVQMLDESGIGYQMEHRSGEISIRFESQAGMMMFTALEKTGFLNKVAEARLRIGADAATPAVSRT